MRSSSSAIAALISQFLRQAATLSVVRRRKTGFRPPAWAAGRPGTVAAVSTLTCPGCGEKVKVPSGHHVVTALHTNAGKPTRITIDGKALHSCRRDPLPALS